MGSTTIQHSVLYVKAVVAAVFNQEKALVGAFSVIVQLHRLIVPSTNLLLCGGVRARPAARNLTSAHTWAGQQQTVPHLTLWNNTASLAG